jgi:alpha-glucosidase
VLGSWNPFFRNHAEYSSISQEFYRWDVVADAARKAVDTRYRLLDYTYTNFYHQNQTGMPMLTPLMWQYPNDAETFGIELQFFAGEALMVAPVTTPNSTEVTFYMPNDLFYDFDTFERVDGKGELMTRREVGLSEIPVYIRGGHIVPMRTKSAYTTTALRRQPFELLIALDARGEAQGTLYLDDGVSIEPALQSLLEFSYKRGVLTMKGKFGYDPKVGITRITVLGLASSKCAGRSTDANALTRDIELSLMKSFAYNVEKC